MELEYKYGERVFDIRYGWGTVVKPMEECFVTVKFDEDGRDKCYDERTAVTLLSYEEYELNGQCSVNYQNYVGQWGIFTDYHGEFENVAVGKLQRVIKDGKYTYFVVNTCRGDEQMRCFVPFTEDMLERLGLK